MTAPNPFTPPNQETVRTPSWRRPIQIGIGMGVALLALFVIVDPVMMMSQCIFRFTVEFESKAGAAPTRVFLLSRERLTEDPNDYREPWGGLNEYGYSVLTSYAYEESFTGEPMLFEIRGDSFDRTFSRDLFYLRRFVVLAEWPDGTKSAQIETLPDYLKSKTVRVHLVR